MTIEEIKKIPFVFIVGRGRSGTTLLQNIMDANPHVVLPIESRLIIHLKQKYFKISYFTDSIIDDLITDLYKDKMFVSNWNVNKEKLTSDLKLQPKEQLNFETICKIIYLSYPSMFDKSSIKIIGDKNPTYSIFIPELLEVFPNALFIHIIRDYRDNIISNRNSFGRKSVWLLGYGWLIFNYEIEKIKQFKPNNFFTLRYEDLVNYPEQKVSALCKFLQLTYNPNMLNFYKKIKFIKDKYDIEALETIHKNLDKPINTNAINKWKEQLTRSEIEVLDYICGDYAKNYLYEPTTTKPSLNLFKQYFFGRIRYSFDILVIKTYYSLPFFIRDFSSLFSRKLYEWFHFTTYYNHTDFLFEKDNQK